MESIKQLVRIDEGIVSRKIFNDEKIYRAELESVFAKVWLFVGHESQIEQAGDYIVSYMGEDPVIVCRDMHSRIRIFLNSCPHRGMKVCRSDAGNAAFFRCSYHGWTFANDGKLTGVPRFQDAYFGELDKEHIGLVEVPRVETYGGFIFGCWDENVMPLADYLGDMRWYLDIIIARQLGGLEVIGGQQRYVVPANWKIAADNFAGDDYHVLHTHASSFKLGILPPYDTMAAYVVAFDHGHGMGDLPSAKQRYQDDLHVAGMLGPEVIEYVQELQRRLEERVAPFQAELYALGEGNIFPNFSWNDFSALHGMGLFQWHPKGPDKMEVWETYAFDRAAPQSLKDLVRVQFSQEQAVSGFFGQDDQENFEQVTEATRGAISQRYSFDYTMGLRHEGEVQVPGLPGRIGPHYSEQNQRNFYRYWSELMCDGDGE